MENNIDKIYKLVKCNNVNQVKYISHIHEKLHKNKFNNLNMHKKCQIHCNTIHKMYLLKSCLKNIHKKSYYRQFQKGLQLASFLV